MNAYTVILINSVISAVQRKYLNNLLELNGMWNIENNQETVSGQKCVCERLSVEEEWDGIGSGNGRE